MPIQIDRLHQASPTSEFVWVSQLQADLVMLLGGDFPSYLALPETENGNVPDGIRENYQAEVTDKVGMLSWVEFTEKFDDATNMYNIEGSIYFGGNREVTFMNKTKYYLEFKLKQYFRYYSINSLSNFILQGIEDVKDTSKEQNQFFLIRLNFKANYFNKLC